MSFTIQQTFTIEEVALHSAPNDYWLVMGGDVYEFKDWVHPGGWYFHEKYAGGKMDALASFEGAHGAISAQTFEANDMKARKIGTLQGSAPADTSKSGDGSESDSDSDDEGNQSDDNESDEKEDDDDDQPKSNADSSQNVSTVKFSQ